MFCRANLGYATVLRQTASIVCDGRHKLGLVTLNGALEAGAAVVGEGECKPLRSPLPSNALVFLRFSSVLFRGCGFLFFS